MLPTLPRRSDVPFHYTARRFQASSSYHHESPTATPSLPAIIDGLTHFGAASFSLCYDLHVCLALRAGYDAIKSDCTSRHLLRTLSLPLLALPVAGQRW